MQQAKLAVRATNLVPVANAKVMYRPELKFKPRYVDHDSDRPIASRDLFSDRDGFRPIEFFEEVARYGDANVYCFHPDGQHGHFDIATLEDIDLAYEQQENGWRFLSQTERSMRFVPGGLDPNCLKLIEPSDEIKRVQDAKMIRHYMLTIGRIPQRCLSSFWFPPVIPSEKEKRAQDKLAAKKLLRVYGGTIPSSFATSCLWHPEHYTHCTAQRPSITHPSMAKQ